MRASDVCEFRDNEHMPMETREKGFRRMESRNIVLNFCIIIRAIRARAPEEKIEKESSTALETVEDRGAGT